MSPVSRAHLSQDRPMQPAVAPKPVVFAAALPIGVCRAGPCAGFGDDKATCLLCSDHTVQGAGRRGNAPSPHRMANCDGKTQRVWAAEAGAECPRGRSGSLKGQVRMGAAEKARKGVTSRAGGDGTGEGLGRHRRTDPQDTWAGAEKKGA